MYPKSHEKHPYLSLLLLIKNRQFYKEALTSNKFASTTVFSSQLLMNAYQLWYSDWLVSIL